MPASSSARPTARVVPAAVVATLTARRLRTAAAGPSGAAPRPQDGGPGQVGERVSSSEAGSFAERVTRAQGEVFFAPGRGVKRNSHGQKERPGRSSVQLQTASVNGLSQRRWQRPSARARTRLWSLSESFRWRAVARHHLGIARHPSPGLRVRSSDPSRLNCSCRLRSQSRMAHSPGLSLASSVVKRDKAS